MYPNVEGFVELIKRQGSSGVSSSFTGQAYTLTLRRIALYKLGQLRDLQLPNDTTCCCQAICLQQGSLSACKTSAYIAVTSLCMLVLLSNFRLCSRDVIILSDNSGISVH